jgi:hypothetical protein
MGEKGNLADAAGGLGSGAVGGADAGAASASVGGADAGAAGDSGPAALGGAAGSVGVIGAVAAKRTLDKRDNSAGDDKDGDA